MLNIGFIGCGGIARHHASCLSRIRGARIVAAADVVADAAEAFARDFGAEHHFADFRAVLDLPEIDAVWVCTPTCPAPRAGHCRSQSRQACLLREAHGAEGS